MSRINPIAVCVVCSSLQSGIFSPHALSKIAASVESAASFTVRVLTGRDVWKCVMGSCRKSVRLWSTLLAVFAAASLAALTESLAAKFVGWTLLLAARVLAD
jgi:hypothetical protein